MTETAARTASLAERDDELRRLVIEMEQLDQRRAAVQERIKLLLGMAKPRRARSRFSQADLDRLASGRA